MEKVKRRANPRFVNTLMPYEFYVDIYLLGKLKVFKKRKHLRIGNLFIPLSRVLWSIQHPDEVLLPTDDVHHKDGNKNNDSFNNLERMPRQPHMKMHRKEFKQKEADISLIRRIVKEDSVNMFGRLPRRGRGLFENRATT